MADSPPYPGTPRWVKVSGIIAIALVLFVLFVLVAGAGGPHGPGRHLSPGDAAAHSRWGLLVLLGILFAASVALNWSGRWPWWPQTARGWPAMTMPPGLRKLVLTAHVASSVATLGAVAGFLALSIAGLASQSAQMVRAAYLSMELTAWFVILPLLLASLLTGVAQALGTTWGLLRHYWVLVKLLLTLLVTVVLLVQMDGINHIARAAAEMPLSATDLLALRRSIRTHAAGGLLVLLLPVALSIYKPRGMTRHGWRRQRDEQALANGRQSQ
jgi:hypothetical protein